MHTPNSNKILLPNIPLDFTTLVIISIILFHMIHLTLIPKLTEIVIVGDKSHQPYGVLGLVFNSTFE